MINAMSYVVVQTPYLAQWLDMAGSHIGLQVECMQPDACARLRMDEKVQRLLVCAADSMALTMGYEVPAAADLPRVQQALEAAGYPTTAGTEEEKRLRGVIDFFHFRDPDGNRIEVAWNLQSAATPFQPGRPIGGFRTGELGIGHVALMTAHFERMCHLYKEVLGFRVSDRASAPFKVEFLHVNPRHHTIGIADTGTGAGIYHLMLEYNDFDDVGRAYDMALEKPECIGVTLGRHINDHVTSFYLKNPDGWMFELGWAGRTIGPDWQVEELPGMSLWGHDRTWLPPEKRAEARRILRRLADSGLRAPVVTHTQTAKAKQ
ncbi:VOC family protein [Pseudomonas boanensis]|uniref:VOC family protein n=1 Tax=Metapseudomonas boanensis TaxID=2822138 RepID=UPI0035D4A87C